MLRRLFIKRSYISLLFRRKKNNVIFDQIFFMKYTLTLFISGLFLLSQAAHGQEMYIKTIAGTGVQGFSGDGAAATGADLYGPHNVAVDNAGNVYFVDYFNFRVRKISSTTGDITTIAGNGSGGYINDTTIATTVPLNPEAVAVDKYGNVYISDDADVILIVNTSGIIHRIAGITSIGGYAGDGGLAINAKLDVPRGLAVDNLGNIYFADAFNNVVRKINTAGIISTVAGDDTAGYVGDGFSAVTAKLDSPVAVAVDYIGNLYISDYKNNVVRVVDTFGVINTYAGNGLYGYSGDNGLAVNATLRGPAYLAVDTFGNVFIPDENNNVIREVKAASGVITTVAGNGSAGFGGDLGYALGANLHIPYGVAVDIYGSIYVADANNERIREVYNPYLSVKNISANTNITAYPNPSTGFVTLSGLQLAEKVSVYDVLGRQIGNSWDITANGSQTFDISSFSAGVYMLQVNDAQGNKVAVARLVKE